MKDLFILTASAMPEDVLLDELQEALTNYKTIPSEDNKMSLDMLCFMFTIRNRTNGDIGEAIKMAKGIDDIDRKMSIFDTNSN